MTKQIRQKFCQQRWFASKRSIGWNMSYQEWLMVWGKFLPLRGRGKGKYCMARYGDIGPYEIGNVYITTNEQNNLDQAINNHSSIARHPIKLINEKDGSIIEFASKGQVSKFFNRVNNGLPSNLKKGQSFRGWKIYNE